MKTQKTTKVTKLTASFDNELKSILLRDLAVIRVTNLMNAIYGMNKAA